MLNRIFFTLLLTLYLSNIYSQDTINITVVDTFSYRGFDRCNDLTCLTCYHINHLTHIKKSIKQKDTDILKNIDVNDYGMDEQIFISSKKDHQIVAKKEIIYKSAKKIPIKKVGKTYKKRKKIIRKFFRNCKRKIRTFTITRKGIGCIF